MQHLSFTKRHKKYNWNHKLWSAETIKTSTHLFSKRVLVEEKSPKPSVKYGGGSLMLWGLLPSGSDALVKIDDSMNSVNF